MAYHIEVDMLFMFLFYKLTVKNLLQSDGKAGIGICAACEMAGELSIFAAWLLK